MKKYLSEIRNYNIVKANALIQESRFSLTVQEQKIVLYLVSKVKPSDDDFKLYEFSIKEFCEICGIDEKNGTHYIEIKTAIKNLTDKSRWIILDDGRETLIRWIEKPYIEPRNGTIKIRLDKDLKPYLLQLQEKFTQYSLYYILGMRSKYSIRLYELLKSYEYKKQYEFSMDNLKALIGAEKYKQHNDFTRFAFIPAINEINELGDIQVSHEFIKSGRKYAYVVFHIQAKTDMSERMKIWVNIEKRITPQ